MSKKRQILALVTNSRHDDWKHTRLAPGTSAAAVAVRRAQAQAQELLEAEQAETHERAVFEKMRDASIAKFKAKYPNGAKIEAATFFE